MAKVVWYVSMCVYVSLSTFVLPELMVAGSNLRLQDVFDLFETQLPR